MAKYTKRLEGVCPQMVEYSISEDNSVHDIKFIGGCNGNLQAISKLCNGKHIDELDALLSGIKCGPRQTSCSNELVKAIKNSTT